MNNTGGGELMGNSRTSMERRSALVQRGKILFGRQWSKKGGCSSEGGRPSV